MPNGVDAVAGESNRDKRCDCNSGAVSLPYHASPPSANEHNTDDDAISPSPFPTPIYLSDPGEGISEVELVKWHITEHSHINEFDPLCEVQSDKASVEITSRHAGVVSKLNWKVGQIVKVGDVLCEVSVEGGEGSQEASSTQTHAESPSETPSPSRASTSTSTSTGATSSATPTTHTPSSSPSSSPSSPPSPPPHIRSLAVPSVRRLCREHSLQVEDITGTGKDGRVMKEDVLRFIENGNKREEPASQAIEAVPPPSPKPSTPSASPSSSSLEPIPLTGTRKAMFKSLSLSTSIPHFTFSEEVDVTELESVRVALNKQLASTGATTTTTTTAPVPSKVTLLAYLLKALSMALHSNPIFTHRLESSTSGDVATRASEARLHPQSSHDVSIALSTSTGLLTPTLLGLERKSVLHIAGEIAALQTTVAAGNSLTHSQMGNGGLLTFSNIGTVGGTAASPVLPPTGQLAIGAVCKARWLPRYHSGDVAAPPVPRLILPATFAGDHRILQGTELAKLVCDWKALCEAPAIWSARMV